MWCDTIRTIAVRTDVGSSGLEGCCASGSRDCVLKSGPRYVRCARTVYVIVQYVYDMLYNINLGAEVYAVCKNCVCYCSACIYDTCM